MEAETYTENTDPLERQRAHRPQNIPGWGVDLAPADRPAVPKERTPPRLADVPWDSPTPQHVHLEVFHSTERPGLTPVFGTSVPPSGLSGMLRRVAYRFSENDLRHWAFLLAADRVNVGEGLLSDLAQGRIPNLLAEMGAGAEWRYNRAGFIRKAAVAGLVVGTVLYLLRRPRR